MTDYKVIVEKEFYTLNKNKPTIGLVMMVKNEHKRLHVSLNSVVGIVDALIMFDTGSTDDTLEIIQTFAEKHKINLYLIQGTFVNFAVSRNVVLDYADKINVHYLLFFDCNDELRGGENLKKWAKMCMDKPEDGFLTCQQWWSGKHDKYYNVRFVKNRCGWRYKGSVHEWVYDTRTPTGDATRMLIKMPDDIIIYQDRTQDDDKTSKRFTRDKVLLLQDIAENPNNPRALFYLAQTCQCLYQFDEAMYYSKLRLEFTGPQFNQFDEERFHSFMRCGDCAFALGHEWSDVMGWYMKAYVEFARVEPLIKMADYYRIKADSEAKIGHQPQAFYCWRTSYMFLHEACELKYPDHCMLFVDRGMYDYYRWHVLGMVGIHIDKLEEGKLGCLKALTQDINKELNQKQLQLYIEAEKKKTGNNPVDISIPDSVPNINETKKQFIDRTVQELKITLPNIPLDKLEKRALVMWKKRKE